MGKIFLATFVALGFFCLTSSVSAASDSLSVIYQNRSDLQQAFDATTGLAKSPKAGFLIDLEDWAKQYGWREHPELSAYAPRTEPPTQGSTPAPAVSAQKYLVIDESSGQILAAQGAEQVWPIASITKLMTAEVALQKGINMEAIAAIKNGDNVGGARLYVGDGTTFKVRDLFSAMLIGSANNAANAIARMIGPNFVVAMNKRAAELHLSHATFVDPTGIELGNVATAREVAVLAEAAFENDMVRQLTTTVKKEILAVSLNEWRKLTTTNWLLYYPQYDDVYVTAGKTGYLDESGWNLVVRMRPSSSAKQKEVLIVTFGSASRTDSFNDAEALAKWVWNSFTY